MKIKINQILIVLGLIVVIIVGIKYTEKFSMFNEPKNKEDSLKILGLNSGASEMEIGKAFRKLSIKYHPDKNPNMPDEAEFGVQDQRDIRYINNARDILLGKQVEENINVDQTSFGVDTNETYSLFLRLLDLANKKIQDETLSIEDMNDIKEYILNVYNEYNPLLDTLSNEQKNEIIAWYEHILKIIEIKIRTLKSMKEVEEIKKQIKGNTESKKESEQMYFFIGVVVISFVLFFVYYLFKKNRK